MRRLVYIFLLSVIIAACGTDAPPEGAALTLRDSLPVMTTKGVSKLISDSGVIRYKIIAEEWQVFDKTTPPRQYFPKGIFLERFDDNFKIDMYITADTAFWYNQNLWELRGRVCMENLADGTVFNTEKLWWDMNRREFYSNVYMRIQQPDQMLEGDKFTSNESLTEYTVSKSRGYRPMPKDEEKEL